MPDKTRVDGTNIELYDVSPWSRSTIADGKWLNSNTIQPLEDNEYILASAIGDVSGAVDLIQAQSDVVDVVGSYEQLVNYNEQLTDRDIVKVLVDSRYDSAESYNRMIGGEPGSYTWSAIGSIDRRSNWTEQNSQAQDYIKNKPGETNLVAGPNVYIYEDGNDLIVSAHQAQVQSDWTEIDPNSASYIQNKPEPLEISAGKDIRIDEVGSTITIGVSADYYPMYTNPSGYLTEYVQADWNESDTTSASYIQNKPSTFLNLLTEDADQIISGADLNDYTTPKSYFIPSALDMKEIDNTPYAQMGLSNPQKTGQSQLYVFKTKSSNGRITQLLLTPYHTDPADDNALGIWYRQSSEESNLHWGTWHRVGEGNGSGSGLTIYDFTDGIGSDLDWNSIESDIKGNKTVILRYSNRSQYYGSNTVRYYSLAYYGEGAGFIDTITFASIICGGFMSELQFEVIKAVRSPGQSGTWTSQRVNSVNADMVDGKHIVVGSVGTDSNTLYFV